MPKFETIGVISDVHANYVALEAALEEMARRNVDAIFFLVNKLFTCTFNPFQFRITDQ